MSRTVSFQQTVARQMGGNLGCILEPCQTYNKLKTCHIGMKMLTIPLIFLELESLFKVYIRAVNEIKFTSVPTNLFSTCYFHTDVPDVRGNSTSLV